MDSDQQARVLPPPQQTLSLLVVPSLTVIVALAVFKLRSVLLLQRRPSLNENGGTLCATDTDVSWLGVMLS